MYLMGAHKSQLDEFMTSIEAMCCLELMVTLKIGINFMSLMEIVPRIITVLLHLWSIVILFLVLTDILMVEKTYSIFM